MKKIFFLLTIIFALSASALAQSDEYYGDIFNWNSLVHKFVFDGESIRIIVFTNSTEEKQGLLQKGCKIIHELEEETAVECPQDIAGAIPNKISDRKHKLMDDMLPKNAVPKYMEPTDIWDNTYLGIAELWKMGITGKDRVVAIMDTGIDYNHPALKNHILANASFVSYTNDSMDDYGHGTHVAGIIASDGNPEITICYKQAELWNEKVDCSDPHDFEQIIPNNASKGVAPESMIMMAKVCGYNGECYESDIIAGLEWAAKGVEVATKESCYEKCKSSSSCCKRMPECSYADRVCTGNYTKTEIVKPDVISMSLGSEQTWLFANCDKDPFAKKINEFVRKNKIPIVVAAGNAHYGVSSPACAKEAIAVGAVGGFDWECWLNNEQDCYYKTITYFSGRGFSIKDHGVLAPGVAVFSTLPNEKYGFMSGTSVSAPYAAGLIVLLKQRRSTYSPHSIKNVLFKTATDVPYGFYFDEEEEYKIYEQGYGLINAKAVG